MEDNKIRNLAKKILHAKTFQELHDIIMVYANDELNFVEFPDSFDFIPTGGKQDHEKTDHQNETWPDRFADLPAGLPPTFPGKAYPGHRAEPRDVDPSRQVQKNPEMTKSLKAFRDLIFDA